jgi:hypothetical protein
MEDAIRKVYEDTFSNVFDSVSTAEGAFISCQATLTKMILCLQSPVLSIPQMFDSLPILRMAQDPLFLVLLKKGIISTSLPSGVDSLKAYAEVRLQPSANYIFSSLPFLYSYPYSSPTMKEKLLNEVYAALLNNIQKNKTDYPNELQEYHVFFDTFVSGIRSLDESIAPSNYRQNLKVEGDLISKRVSSNLDKLKEQYKDDPLISELERIVQPVLTDNNQKNFRAAYYRAIDSQENLRKNDKDNLKRVIDISYNQSIAAYVALKTRNVADTENAYESALVQSPASTRTESKLMRVYDEFQSTNAESTSFIGFSELGEILNVIESAAKKDKILSRDETAQHLFERYCDILGKECAISATPMKDLQGDPFEISVENVAVKNTEGKIMKKRLQKTVLENGTIEWGIGKIDEDVTCTASINERKNGGNKKVASIMENWTLAS